jgi:hypothetical protein
VLGAIISTLIPRIVALGTHETRLQQELEPARVWTADEERPVPSTTASARIVACAWQHSHHRRRRSTARRPRTVDRRRRFHPADPAYQTKGRNQRTPPGFRFRHALDAIARRRVSVRPPDHSVVFSRVTSQSSVVATYVLRVGSP